MNKIHRLIMGLFLAFALFASPANVNAAYGPIDLGTLGNESSSATAINNLNQVVGFSRTEDGSEHAFLWENGDLTDLETLSQYRNANALGINDLVQVVGWSEADDSLTHAVLWSDGEVIDLGLGYATDINNNGQIVGRITWPDGFNGAFIWEGGNFTRLDETGMLETSANAINEIGQVVGMCKSDMGEPHACLWENGSMIDLGTLGGNWSEAFGINDMGQIVGTSLTADGEWHAFLWQNQEMIDLTPNYPMAHAFGINNSGEIAISTTGNATIWRNGEMIYLPLLHGIWSTATAINDMGNVVGDNGIPGGNGHATLWPANADDWHSLPNTITLGALVLPEEPLTAGVAFNTEISFCDTNGNETHSMVWDWGDGNISQESYDWSEACGSFSSSYSYENAGNYTIRVTVTDSNGDSAGTEAGVNVLEGQHDNQITVGSIAADVSMLPVGTPYNVWVEFFYTNPDETYSVVWDWGDGSQSDGLVTELDGYSGASGSHIYQTPGTYSVNVMVLDSYGNGSVSFPVSVLVFGDLAPSIEGHGWFSAPNAADPTHSVTRGKVHFGFEAGYDEIVTGKEGETSLHFKFGHSKFRLNTYDYFLMDGAKGMFLGRGALNGESGYYFALTTLDGGAEGVDKIRIKIWKPDNDNNDILFYDSQPGDSEFAEPTTILSGGSIVNQ